MLGSSNGFSPGPLYHEPRRDINNNRFAGGGERMIANAIFARTEMIRQWLDQRRSVDAECGYPTGYVPARVFHDLWRRNSIARRVVRLYPKETWQVQPWVYEKDKKGTTPFEKAWNELGSTVRPEKSWYKSEMGSPIFSYLKRLDEMCGIGRYGIMLLGLDDGQPLGVPVGSLAQRMGKSGDGVSVVTNQEVAGKRWDLLNIVANEWGDKEPFYTAEWKEEEAGTDKEGRRLVRYKPVTNKLVPVEKLGQTSVEQRLLGTDAQYWDWLNQQPASSKAKKGGVPQLTSLRVYSEASAQVVQWDNNPLSPRFGMPVRYLIWMADPAQNESFGLSAASGSQVVHWSRIIHVADNMSESEWAGAPRLEPVLNDVLDIKKIYGADAEGFWKSGLQHLFFTSQPELQGDIDIDPNQLRDMMEQLENSTQKWGYLKGLNPVPIAPAVSDPTTHGKCRLECIAMAMECPMRVLMGSERGELASTQDDDSWNDKVKERSTSHATPNLIVPLPDRLIGFGTLPEPEEVIVEWPDVSSSSPEQKSIVAMNRMTAISIWSSGGGAQIIPPETFLVKELGNYTEDEAKEVLEQAEKNAADDAAEAMLKAEEAGHVPVPGEGFEKPPEKVPPEPVKVKPGEKLVFPKVPVGNVDGTQNIFCPTGEGGGKDPSCGKDEAGGGGEGGGKKFKTNIEGRALKALKEKDPDGAKEFNRLRKERGALNKAAAHPDAGHATKARAQEVKDKIAALKEKAFAEGGVAKVEPNVPDKAEALRREAAGRGAKPAAPVPANVPHAGEMAEAWRAGGVVQRIEAKPNDIKFPKGEVKPEDAEHPRVRLIRKDGELYVAKGHNLLKAQQAAVGDVPQHYGVKDADDRGGERAKAEKRAAEEAELAAVRNIPNPPHNPSAETEQFVKTGSTSKEELGGGISGSYVVTLESGTKGVWKPHNEENSANRRGIKNGTCYRREAAAYDVARECGLDDLVPMTVERTIDGVAGSLQKFATDAKPGMKIDGAAKYDGDHDLARASAFDYLTSNTDRHHGNWMIQQGRQNIVLIDHGLAFPPKNDQYRSWLMDEAQDRGLKVPHEVKNWNEDKIVAAVKAHGLSDDEVNGVKDRLKVLKEHAGKAFDSHKAFKPKWH